MLDSSSTELLEEIRKKRRLIRYWPVTLFLGLASLLGIAPLARSWVSGALLLGLVGLCVWLARRDEIRKTVVLMYELDDSSEAAYQAFHNGFDWLAQSQRAWHYEAKGRVNDWKKNAGAASLVRRSLIRPAKADPPNVKTNLAVPMLPVGRQQVYFLPDRVLVFHGSSVGAVGYDQLRIDAAGARFIEEESVPADAKTVGSTWQYVNKNGGPDRRFKDNRELPILLYGELRLTSPTGLNEVVQVSNPEAVLHFAAGAGSLASAVLALRPRKEPRAESHPHLPKEPSLGRTKRNEVFAPGWESRTRVDIPPVFAIEAVGESFHIDTLRTLWGTSTDTVEERTFRAFLIPETQNPYDPAATLIWADGFGPVGHISRGDARTIADLRRRLLANGEIAVVAARAVGGWGVDAAGREIPPGVVVMVDDGSTNSADAKDASEATLLPADWKSRDRVALPGTKPREVSAVGEGQYQEAFRQLLKQGSAAGSNLSVLLVPIPAESDVSGLTAVVCHETAGELGRLSVPTTRKYARFLASLDQRKAVATCEATCVAEGKGFGLKLRLAEPEQGEGAGGGGATQ